MARATVNAPPGVELRDYQHVAVDFIRNRKRAGLFLDMGLGKTAISLTALETRHLPALVVGPKRVAEEVWPTEAEKFRPELSVALAAGPPAKRQAALESSADIVVISRDNLADAVPFADRFKTFIIDELSSFKNRSSQRWKNAKKITRARGMENVWGLTGTPAPNGLLDLWPQMYLLDGGEALGTTLGGYKERYFTAGRVLPNTNIVTEWIPKPGAAARINRLLETTCLSMSTEGRVALPPVTYHDIVVPHEPRVAEAYRRFKKDLVLGAGLVDDESHTASSAAVLSQKLGQLNAGILYADDADLRGGKYTQLSLARARRVQEIVEASTSPVLVFYQYRAELDLLRKALGKEARTVDEPGVIRDWNDGRVPVLLAHPASAGHGINLQFGGHTVVWSSLTWNLEEYQQANKRLARSGQKNPVVIHRLVTPGTIDDAKRQVLEGKASVQAALFDYLESPV